MSQQILDRIKYEDFPGETYQHYKGKIVSVLGVAHAAPPTRICDMQVFAIARWADVTGREIQIFRDDVMCLRFSHSLDVEPLVLYACSGDLRVRPVSEFLGEASPGVSRFTRVGAKFLDAKNPAGGLEELPRGAKNLPESLDKDFPDDLREFAAQRYPQGFLAFHQEIEPEGDERLRGHTPTGVAVILDDKEPYGVIDCVKIDGQWQTRIGFETLAIRCLISSLKSQHRKIEARCLRGIEKVIQKAIDDGRLFAADDVVQMEISPLPLYQELGIDD